MTPVEFLTARYDEREAKALAAADGPWKVDDEGYAEAIYAADGFTTVVAGGRWGDEASVFNDTADALFIAANHPAYVLADIAAKRAILRQYATAVENEARWRQALSVSVPGESFASSLALVDSARNVVSILRPVVWALCRPFADHPAYNPSWSA